MPVLKANRRACSMAKPAAFALTLAVMLTAASAANAGVTPSLFPSTGGEASLSYNFGKSISAEQVTCHFDGGVEREGTVSEETPGKGTVTCPVPAVNDQRYGSTISVRLEDGSAIQSAVPIVYYSKLKTVRVSPKQVSMFSSTDVEVTLKARSSPSGLDLLADATGSIPLAAAPAFCSFDGLRVPAKRVAFTEEPSDVQDGETGDNALVTFVVTCPSPPNLDVGAVTLRASLEGTVTGAGSARLTVSYSPDFNGAGAALDSFSNVAVLGGMDRDDDSEDLRWSRFLLEDDNESGFDFYGPCNFYGPPPGSPGYDGAPPSVPGAPGSIPSGFPGSNPPDQPGVLPPGYPGSPGGNPPGTPGSNPPGTPGSNPPGTPGSNPPGSPGSNPPGSPGSPGAGTPGTPGSPTGGTPPPSQPDPGCTVRGCPEQKGDGGPYVPPPPVVFPGPLRAPAPAPGPLMMPNSRGGYSVFGVIAIGSGYLTACEVCFDPTHSGTCDAEDLTCTTDAEGFGACTRTGDSLLFPEVEKNTLSGFCVNNGTGLPLSIPLSSPTECAMVTSLTTVKQKMMETQLVNFDQSADFLASCFGLPAQPDVCNYNALEGILQSITGDSGSADVSAALILLTGSKLTSVSVLGSSLIGGPLGVVADLINTIVSGKCMAANNVVTAGSRRLLDTGNLLELENASFLLQVVNETIHTASLLNVGGLNNVSESTLLAVVSAMVVVNQKLQDLVASPSYAASLFGNATAAAEVLKRLYTIDVVSQTTFKDQIQALANGTLSLADFVSATSSSAFEVAAAKVVLPISPGLPPPSASPAPAPAPKSPVPPPGALVTSSKKNVGAIVGGVVGGFFGVALLAAAIAFFVHQRKKANARFNPLYPETATGPSNAAAATGSYVPPTEASVPVTSPEGTSSKRPSVRAAPVQGSEGTSSKRPSVRVVPEDGTGRRESEGPSSPV